MLKTLRRRLANRKEGKHKVQTDTRQQYFAMGLFNPTSGEGSQQLLVRGCRCLFQFANSTQATFLFVVGDAFRLDKYESLGIYTRLDLEFSVDYQLCRMLGVYLG